MFQHPASVGETDEGTEVGLQESPRELEPSKFKVENKNKIEE